MRPVRTRAEGIRMGKANRKAYFASQSCCCCGAGITPYAAPSSGPARDALRHGRGARHGAACRRGIELSFGRHQPFQFHHLHHSVQPGRIGCAGQCREHRQRRNRRQRRRLWRQLHRGQQRRRAATERPARRHLRSPDGRHGLQRHQQQCDERRQRRHHLGPKCADLQHPGRRAGHLGGFGITVRDLWCLGQRDWRQRQLHGDRRQERRPGRRWLCRHHHE